MARTFEQLLEEVFGSDVADISHIRNERLRKQAAELKKAFEEEVTSPSLAPYLETACMEMLGEIKSGGLSHDIGSGGGWIGAQLHLRAEAKAPPRTPVGSGSRSR